MDRRQIGLKLTVDALGLPFTVASFNDRLILQKAVCLAQAAGVHLGYSFRWYLHGPYSSALASDAGAVIVESEDEWRGWNLDEPSRRRLDHLAPLMQADDRRRLARRLELLASIHFIRANRSAPLADGASVRQALCDLKKPCELGEVETALGELRDHGLLSECPV